MPAAVPPEEIKVTSHAQNVCLWYQELFIATLWSDVLGRVLLGVGWLGGNDTSRYCGVPAVCGYLLTHDSFCKTLIRFEIPDQYLTQSLLVIKPVFFQSDRIQFEVLPAILQVFFLIQSQVKYSKNKPAPCMSSVAAGVTSTEPPMRKKAFCRCNTAITVLSSDT